MIIHILIYSKEKKVKFFYINLGIHAVIIYYCVPMYYKNEKV